MKPSGMILIFAGVVCLSAGLFAYYAISQSDYSGQVYDVIMFIGYGLGFDADFTLQEQIKHFVLYRQGTLLLIGAVSLVLGIICKAIPESTRK